MDQKQADTQLPRVAVSLSPDGNDESPCLEVCVDNDAFTATGAAGLHDATSQLGQWLYGQSFRLRIKKVAADATDHDADVSQASQGQSPTLELSTSDGDRIVKLSCLLPLSEGGQLVVGRSRQGTDLIVDDDHVSRQHLRFFVRRGQHLVEDLKSRWGTSLNNAPITTPVELSDGDEIAFGKSSIIYRYAGAADQPKIRPTSLTPPEAQQPASDTPDLIAKVAKRSRMSRFTQGIRRFWRIKALPVIKHRVFGPMLIVLGFAIVVIVIVVFVI